MGFRLRKSKKIGSARVTLSKSGLHTSIGGKGFRVGVGSNGKIRTTVSIPGTGISFSSTQKMGGSSRRSSRSSGYDPFPNANPLTPIVALLCIIPAFALWGFIYMTSGSMVGSLIAIAVILAVIYFVFIFKPKEKAEVPTLKADEWQCPSCGKINLNKDISCKDCGEYK